MKSGFTLVELSIVLVVIGLLIGGVLVGQSLIESAKISHEVRRLSQYAIAIEQYKQKFKQEAGDSNLFYPAGNNDKSSFSVSTCPTAAWEVLSAWSHLTQSGILTGEKYVWPNPGVYCAGWINNNGSGFLGVTPTNELDANGQINPIIYTHDSNGIYDFVTTKDRYKRKFYTIYDPEVLWGLENIG